MASKLRPFIVALRRLNGDIIRVRVIATSLAQAKAFAAHVLNEVTV